MDQATIDKALRRQRARASERNGRDAQEIVRLRLIGMGMKLVETVATPSVNRRIAGKVVGRKFIKKVSGDIRAVIDGPGTSVLCEVKFRPDRLRFSDLYEHQANALDQHHAAGGISLLAWASRHGVVIMRWPWPTFRAGDSLRYDEACDHAFNPYKP